MTEKTKELLLECKKAGYEIVTVFVRDKRVPRSITIKSGSWFGDMSKPDGNKTLIKVICGYPVKLGKHWKYSGSKWPKMWSIIKKCGLTLGLDFHGFGLGDCYNVHPGLVGTLTPGCYELEDLQK